MSRQPVDTVCVATRTASTANTTTAATARTKARTFMQATLRPPRPEPSAMTGVELSADDLRAVRNKTTRRLIRHIWDIQYADDAGISAVCAAIRGTVDRVESLNRRIVELDTQGRLL